MVTVPAGTGGIGSGLPEVELVNALFTTLVKELVMPVRLRPTFDRRPA